MSYTRDKDAMTRGVGAIAARDAGNVNALARRRARARYLNDRDRTLSKWTYGPNGGIGAINIEDGGGKHPRPDAPGQGQNPIPGGGGAGAGGSRGRGYTGVITPVTGIYGATSAGGGVVPPRGMITGGEGAGRTGVYQQTIPGIIVDPVRGDLVPTADPGAVEETGSAPGGSGGGGGSQGGGLTPLPPLQLEPLPDLDLVPASKPGLTRNQKLLIGAGAAAALYLIFRKKGRS